MKHLEQKHTKEIKSPEKNGKMKKMSCLFHIMSVYNMSESDL